MSIPARLNIVTIGIADIARSVRVYEALGWTRCSSSIDEIDWFRTADISMKIIEAADAASGTAAGLFPCSRAVAAEA